MYTTLIEASELDKHRQDANWIILDARFSLANTEQGRQAFNLSRIPGAQYAHLDEHLSGSLIPGQTGRHPMPERDVLVDQFRRWGIGKHTQIVVYDDKVGAVAARLWWLCKWLGHERSAVLDGGFAHWSSLGLMLDTSSLDSSSSEPGLGDFTDSLPLLELIDIDQAASGQWSLIDAREADRFAGKHEPIDPVAGHIKGALNHHFMQNVDETGCLLPVQTLRKQFAEFDQQHSMPIAHYCGSGVTAAHNILAMVHAGLKPGALYAGSFSEWITRDAQQYPVASSV